ncbi:hypothetical protein B0T16DRAFT_423980 [Cercophora newfieldiana]|uniref:Uncharacterized protein n=1 Tax=Cercophora newfieldiana TaxID=92897 RepID=A0AA39XTQ7_9PEZI|nr:hypothetical protein B0T16DRAFT_423980 [Cercophora newfieldiana]
MWVWGSSSRGLVALLVIFPSGSEPFCKTSSKLESPVWRNQSIQEYRVVQAENEPMNSAGQPMGPIQPHQDQLGKPVRLDKVVSGCHIILKVRAVDTKP